MNMRGGWALITSSWLSWVQLIPIGIMTTVPAQALTGTLPPLALPAFLVFAVLLVIGASIFFKFGLRRYASASS